MEFVEQNAKRKIQSAKYRNCVANLDYTPSVALRQLRYSPAGKKKKSHFRTTFLFGDPDGNRTRVTAVKGRCLNRLTTGPYLVAATGLEPVTFRV